MKDEISIEGINELPILTVFDGIVTYVSNPFTKMTDYSMQDFLGKEISEVFRILRVGPSINIESISNEPDYFLFTKALEVRFVHIEIVNDVERQTLIIRENPNSRLEDKFSYVNQLLCENVIGVSIYSVPDFTLLKANQVYLDFCDAPYNMAENTYGKKIYDFITGYRGSEAEKIINHVFNGGKSVCIKEMRYDKFSRGITYWDQIITPIKEDGKIKYLITNTQEVTEHVLNKIRLEEKNKQLTTIIKGISDDVTIINKDGLVTDVTENINGKFDHFGRTYKDVYKEIEIFDFDGNIVPLEDTIVARILRGERIHNQKFLVMKGGKKFYYKNSGLPIFNEEGEFELGVIISDDITELMEKKNIIKAQKELLETELQSTKLLQSMSLELICEDNIQMLYDKIIDTAMQIMHSQNASIQMIHPRQGNSHNLQLLAFRGIEAEAVRVWEWLDTESAGTTSSESLRKGKRIVVPNIKDCGFMLGTKDQALYLQIGINAAQSTLLRSRNGRLVGVISTYWNEPHEPSERELRMLDVLARQAADLIEQRQAEVALRESEDKYRTLFNNAEYGFVVIEPMFDENGRVNDLHYLEMNPGFERQTGLSVEQFLHKSLREALPGIEPQWFEIFDQVAKSGKAQRYEAYNYHTNRWYEIIAFPYTKGLLGEQFIDITDRKRNEAEREQLQREKNETLEKAIAMKDEFLSLISHELRTPLNVINTAVQAIQILCKDELSDKGKRYIKIIRQNMFRQLRLVNNLLDITRVDAGAIKLSIKNIDIVHLSSAIVESVRIYALQKDITIMFFSSLTEKVIGIDDEKYERVLLNLLSNAIKFTPQGKSITVKICNTRNGICIEVIDKGIGIPEDKIDVIFERFGQVDSSLSRQAEGAGIGLSLVKRFVDAMGGNISVKSKIGKGTTFVILLPDETVDKESDENPMISLMNNRLVEITNVEFADIYL